MKKMIGVLLSALVFSTAAHAAYEIKTELELAGSEVKTGVIRIEENEKGTLSFGGTTIQIQPTSQGKDLVMMKAEMTDSTNAKLSNQSRIISKLGQAAEIAQHDQDGRTGFRLKMTATKVK